MTTTYHVVDTSRTNTLIGDAALLAAPRACSHRHRTVSAAVECAARLEREGAPPGMWRPGLAVIANDGGSDRPLTEDESWELA